MFDEFVTVSLACCIDWILVFDVNVQLRLLVFEIFTVPDIVEGVQVVQFLEFLSQPVQHPTLSVS
jgi:hypothetical protein